MSTVQAALRRDGILVMLVGGNRAIMGEHANGPWLNLLGGTSTAIMALAAVAFFVTFR